ncbi:unnamed protein product [Mesocestoides corti]|uniref:Multiple inositol polyphosphate phosphatase 1 n=1 Tax=Mesocestoides corti TaxID=53468 RepID=A0A0R3UN17_MESCO|nr:unnamed protein product [Mesocestoides corti]
MLRIYLDILGLLFASLGGLIFVFYPPRPFYDDKTVDGYSLTAFGSKTSYKNHGLKSAHPSLLSGKRLVHINALFRHGTRSPDMDFMTKMAALRTRLQQYLPNLDFPLESGGNASKVLLPSGVEELAQLGIRFRNIVPDSFRLASGALVVSSQTERTLKSARAFISKFFDEEVPITEDSERLRFFAYCTNYIEGIRKNKTVRSEYYKFRDGAAMNRVLAEVINDLSDIHKMAGHEVAAMKPQSPLPGWVRLFRPGHLYVLEYLSDLKQYWTKANPFPINYEQVCPLWGAIMEDLLKAATHDRDLLVAQQHGGGGGGDRGAEGDSSVSQPHRRSVFWFGHAETLLPLVIKLGLFNESVATESGGGEHLMASGFESRLRRLRLEDLPVHNLFRSSHIIPFAGNIAFLLFHCPEAGEEPSLDHYCVEVRLNEQVVEIIPELRDAPRPLRLPRLLDFFKACLPTTYNQAALCDRRTPSYSP